jgi:hypothetical protein
MSEEKHVEVFSFDKANGQGGKPEVSCTVTTVGNGAVVVNRSNHNVSVKREDRNYILKPSDTYKS